MSLIYQDILESKASNRKLLAILLDPDKVALQNVVAIVKKIHESPATHIFVGGSHIASNILDILIAKIKECSNLPVVLFPGDVTQISANADAILFLSLISGRNPDYLIGQQVKAAPLLKKTNLEIIPTGYILIKGGTETAVQKVSKTSPIDYKNIDQIVATAQAAEMLGHKLIYLEAGSGAKFPISPNTIKHVANNISLPLIVGGGIANAVGIQNAYSAGADLVVIGTAFESDINFFS